MSFKNCIHIMATSVMLILSCLVSAETITFSSVGSLVTNGCAEEVAIVGNYAYVTNGDSSACSSCSFRGLSIINVANPASPSAASSVSAPGSSHANVQVVGNYAYMSQFNNGLKIIDVSNPTSAFVAATYENSGFGPYGVNIVGNYAYLATYYELKVLNLANPLSPSLVGSIEEPYRSFRVQVVGSYAYVANNGGGTGHVEIINISNPAAPSLVSRINTTSANGIVVRGDYAYVADNAGGLKIINISNPAAPYIVSSYATSMAQGIDVVGDYAYIADYTSGLKVINISNPASPVLVGSYAGTLALGVTVVGDYVYVCAGAGGLKIFKASNSRPSVASFSKSGNEDSAIVFSSADFTNHFSAIDGPLTKIKIVSLPSNGTLKLSNVAVTLNQEINAADLGNLTFVPNANWNGNTSFSWNGFDGSAYAASPADVTITVNAVDDVPVVTPIAKSVDEDGTVTFTAADFTNHFSDVESEGLSKIQITSLPSNGTLKLSGTPVTLNQEIASADLGNLTFEPAANWNGTISFDWKGCDVSACSDSSNITVTVSAIDDAPVVTSFSKSVNEDGIVTFNATDFSSHMTDVESESLSKIQVLSLPSNGALKLSNVAVTLNQEINTSDLSNLTFVPNVNWNGNTSFSWNGFDGSAYAASPADVTITVNAVDDVPVVTPIAKSVDEDGTVTFTAADFTSHFSDVESEGLSKIQITSLPSNGTLKLSETPVTLNQEIASADLGNLTFVPTENWNGTLSFDWKGCDASACSDSSNITVTVSAIDDAPVVSSFGKSGDEDTTISFNATDFGSHMTDVESESLTKIKVLSLPANGTLKLSSVAVTLNQEINVADLGNLTFEPDANWNGNTSFSWNGYDGYAYAVAPADVTITINPVDDVPVVTPIAKSIDEDGTVAFTVADFTSHFSDVESEGLSKIQITSLPSNGTLKLSETPVTLNQEIASVDLGNLTFVPTENWNGTISFDWKGCDASACSDSSNITVTVSAVNDAPIVSSLSKSVDEDGTVTFTASDFTSHFSDVENDSLAKIQVLSLPSNGTLKLSGVAVTLNQEINVVDLGNLTFVPDANWNGNTSFSWNGFDGSAYAATSASVALTIVSVDDAPEITSFSKSVNEDGVVTFAANDFSSHMTDVESESLTKIQVLSLPANGTLKLSGVAVTLNQEINVADLGNLTFEPDANWNGNTSFIWNGFDGSSYAAATAQVVMTVTAVDDAPEITSFSKSVNEDGVVTFAATDFSSHMTDVETESLTRIQVLSLPANGTLKLSGVAVTLNQEINVADLDTLTFVPDANWNGNTSFIWNGYDGSSYAATTAHVDITINAVNDAPEVASFTKSGDEDTTVSFAAADFTSHMTDVETESLTKIQVLSLPSNGTLKLSNVAVTLNQEINAADLGNLTFVPAANWNGNTNFSWNGFDGSAYAASPADVTITVNAVDDVPVVTPIAKSVNEDGVVTFNATDFTSHFSDVEDEGLAKIQITSLPSNGTLKLSGTPVTLNQEINTSDLNNLTFEPAENWNGSTNFGWKGCDATACSTNAANTNITVNAVADAPVVTQVFKTGEEDTTLHFSVVDFTGHFTDVDGNGLIAIKVLSLPEHGTLKLANVPVALNQEIIIGDVPVLTFEPESNWNGNTSFSWNGCDGTSYAAAPANVTITITSVNDAPVISMIEKSGNQDAVIALSSADFTSHFSDVEHNGLARIQILSLPEHGTLKLDTNAVVLNQEITVADLDKLTFEPVEGWFGETSFVWNGSDGSSYAAQTANVKLTLLSVPVAASYCSEHPYICYVVPPAAVAAGTLASAVLYMSRKHMGCFKHELPTVPTRAVAIEMPKV